LIAFFRGFNTQRRPGRRGHDACLLLLRRPQQPTGWQQRAEAQRGDDDFSFHAKLLLNACHQALILKRLRVI
jgi:hypothetical protein